MSILCKDPAEHLAFIRIQIKRKSRLRGQVLTDPLPGVLVDPGDLFQAWKYIIIKCIQIIPAHPEGDMPIFFLLCERAQLLGKSRIRTVHVTAFNIIIRIQAGIQPGHGDIHINAVEIFSPVKLCLRNLHIDLRILLPHLQRYIFFLPSSACVILN